MIIIVIIRITTGFQCDVYQLICLGKGEHSLCLLFYGVQRTSLVNYKTSRRIQQYLPVSKNISLLDTKTNAQIEGSTKFFKQTLTCDCDKIFTQLTKKTDETILELQKNRIKVSNLSNKPKWFVQIRNFTAECVCKTCL